MGAVVFIEISFDALAYGWPLWYHTRMANSTTNEETPRPEPKPTGSRENRWEIAGYGEPEEATGYEADDDHALYWDQHAEG